jgi:hypothetical protein
VKPEEAEGRFRALLAEAGVDLDGPFEPDTVRRAWEAFKRFAAEPVDGMSPEDDSDMLLVQADGTGESFSFGMLRQFIHKEADGEDGAMEQIECSFKFGDVSDLVELSLSLWSSEVPDGEFFEWVEETPAFRAAAGGEHIPVAAGLHRDEV